MILHFEDVSYRYPDLDEWILKEIHWTISQNQSVLLAGASGSGKSTLCRAAIGLIPHFHGGEFIGHIHVNGLNTRQHPVYRLFSHAGLVFQNTDAQLFNHTVEGELVYGLESLGLTSAEIEKRLAQVCDQVGLGPFLKKSPYTLSGGEKQRVTLGAILALRPKLLLLDEPFTHLDSEGAEMLRSLLRKILSEGMAVAVVEHRLHEVIADIDRLVILHQGKIVKDGTPSQVLSHEVSSFGLNLPPLIRHFKKMGWKGTPLSVNEAIHWLKSQNRSASLKMESSPLVQNLASPSTPGKNQDAIVEMEKVCFSYNGLQVLQDIDLTLMRGECIALLGRNGSGKTTLIKHLNGLLKPKQGKVKTLSHDTRKTPVAKLARHVGFVWQNPNDQLFQATVREEILTGPRVLHIYDRRWCDVLFDRFQLGPLLDRSPFRLSEGQKKRVSFASALAVQPELIVLDEPTAGQDEPFRKELGLLIKELQTEGRTIVLVTHDIEFAAEHASRWIVLGDGKIMADVPPEEIMKNPNLMTKAGLKPTQEFQLRQEIEKALKEEGDDRFIP